MEEYWILKSYTKTCTKRERENIVGIYQEDYKAKEVLRRIFKDKVEQDCKIEFDETKYIITYSEPYKDVMIRLERF